MKKLALILIAIVIITNIYSQVKGLDNDMSVRQFIQLLDEYNIKCYNDSIKTTYDLYEFGNDTIYKLPGIDPGHMPGYIERKDIYEHELPTFIGFREYLKRKYKLK